MKRKSLYDWADAGVTSRTWQSNFLTKCITAEKDPRQLIPQMPYTIPDIGTRKLMAKLVLEEALETIDALGIEVTVDDEWPVKMKRLKFEDTLEYGCELDILDIIDGACDTIYVATGVLVGFNVPDLPHLRQVCAANEAKFPDGKVITDPLTGKYLKPEGWVGPDHETIMIGMICNNQG